jgi:mannobiose 2-epimerase
MKPLIILFSILIFLLSLTGCKKPATDQYLGVEVSEIENELNNLLQTWFPRIIDTVHGGYWTNFEYDWKLSKDQDKMLVTQARGLWTASRAASVFPDNEILRQAADHGYQFLTTQMWDNKLGGFNQYYFVDSARPANNAFKLTYGNAFALFALSEYAKINKDPAVLDWVRKTFNWLEDAAHDSIYLGYFSVVIPKSNLISTEASKAVTNNVRRANWGDPGGKDQNTSIHLMEALTVAYQVMPDELVKKRLAEMLSLVRDTMTGQDGSLRLFFNTHWKAISHKDSSRNYILRHLGMDHISFGHNIETAYLLVDAAEKLYGSPDSATLTVSKKLLDHTLKWGFDKDYYGLFDKGYLFKNTRQVEILDSSKVWWSQVEAWHALALFSSYYPEELTYQDAFRKMWNYIGKEMIDRQYGGWYNEGLDKNPKNKTDRKGHAWKGCYHNGRALMLVYTYAKK